MFEKLNQIVRESEETFFASEICPKAINDAMYEATGAIVDVLKTQLDNGKANDLMSYLTGKQSDYETLTKAMVNKYSNRLNRYFNLSIMDAKRLSEQVIPVVMTKFTKQMANGTKEEKNGIFNLMNWLSGYTVNFETFFLKLNVPAIA